MNKSDDFFFLNQKKIEPFRNGEYAIVLISDSDSKFVGIFEKSKGEFYEHMSIYTGNQNIERKMNLSSFTLSQCMTNTKY